MRFTTALTDLSLTDLRAIARGALACNLSDSDFLQTLSAHKCFVLYPWVVRARHPTGQLARVTRLAYDSKRQPRQSPHPPQHRPGLPPRLNTQNLTPSAAASLPETLKLGCHRFWPDLGAQNHALMAIGRPQEHCIVTLLPKKNYPLTEFDFAGHFSSRPKHSPALPPRF